MSYNIVLVGDNSYFNQDLIDSLKTKNIQTTFTPDINKLTNYLNTHYKSINLLIIAIDDEIASFNTILTLQSRHLFKNIPFIIVGNRNQVIKGLALGATDYIITPCSDDDFSSRIIVTLESLGYVSHNQQCKMTNIQMSFKDYFQSEIKRSERGIYDLSMIFFSLVPIKENKNNNEQFLFLLIKELSSLVHSHLRAADTIVQYGPLNIVGFLPYTTKFNAEAVAEKIESIYKNKLNESNSTKNQYELIYSIVSYPQDGDNPDDLLFNAEQELEKIIEKNYNKNV